MTSPDRNDSPLSPAHQELLGVATDEVRTADKGDEAQHQEPAPPPVDIENMSDDDLRDLAYRIDSLLQARALGAMDPDALVREARDKGFSAKGALEPYIYNGMLVMPGSLTHSSTTSHTCVFANVDDKWCWDHPDVVADDIRRTPGKGGREDMTAVTILPASEGMKVTQVHARASQGAHKMTSSRAYVVKNGELEFTTSRQAKFNFSR